MRLGCCQVAPPTRRALDAGAALTYDDDVDRSQLAAVVLTLLVLSAIAWRLHGPDTETPPPAIVATSAPSTPRKGEIPPTPTAPSVAHRLAGVALGNVRYAVVEQPDGSTALYRAGDDVPGLGQIVEVTENSATFDGPDGRVRLSVKPPPSPTPAPVPPTEAAESKTAPVAFTGSPAPDRSATVSPPSGEPGQPAS